jgi:hypothetical protein
VIEILPIIGDSLRAVINNSEVFAPATSDVEEMMTDYFRRRYGSSAFDHVLARVKEIRENNT